MIVLSNRALDRSVPTSRAIMAFSSATTWGENFPVAWSLFARRFLIDFFGAQRSIESEASPHRDLAEPVAPVRHSPRWDPSSQFSGTRTSKLQENFRIALSWSASPPQNRARSRCHG